MSAAVLIKVDLPNRPEGDLVVITGLGEFPNGGVSLVRMDVLAAYRASQPYGDLTEANWPAGVDVIVLSDEDLVLIFDAVGKKDKKTSTKAAKQEGGN